jgi:hypothetical protein
MVYEEQPEKEGTVTGGRNRKKKKSNAEPRISDQMALPSL